MELEELALFDRELVASLQRQPDDQLKIFEVAASDVLEREVLPNPEWAQPCQLSGIYLKTLFTSSGRTFDVQIALKSTQLATPLRALTAEHIGKLTKVSGIVVSAHQRKKYILLATCQHRAKAGASKVKSRAVGIKIQCDFIFLRFAI